MLTKRFGIFKRKPPPSPEHLSSDSVPQDTVLNDDELTDLNSQDSFPASDPPSYGGTTSVGAPDDRKTPKPAGAKKTRKPKAKRKSA